jgi:hypothetical protein
MDGFETNDLPMVARGLAKGEQQLSDLAGGEPEMPDAGSSSAAVGAGLAALAGVMSKVTQTAGYAAHQVGASHDTYQQSETQARDSMRKIMERHP